MAVLIAAQVPFAQHGHRGQTEFEFVAYPQKRLGGAEFGVTLPVDDVGARHVVQPRFPEPRLHLVLDRLDRRNPRTQRIGHSRRHGGRQVRVLTAHLTGGEGHGGLDAPDVERYEGPVTPPHLLGPAPPRPGRHGAHPLMRPGAVNLGLDRPEPALRSLVGLMLLVVGDDDGVRSREHQAFVLGVQPSHDVGR